MNRSAFEAAQTTNAAEQARKQYNREVILSASPGALLTMLYDRLLLDLNRAAEAQRQQHWEAACDQLLHAQDIVAELRSSLKTDQWQGAAQLQGIYAFVTQHLISANVYRDLAKTEECIRLLEPLRQSWHEALQQTEGAQHPASGTATTAGEPAAHPVPETHKTSKPTTQGGLLGVG